MQKPSIGRIVHYVAALGEHQAAIICAVRVDEPGYVNLTTFSLFGIAIPVRDVPFDETGREPHSWHWPERD